ncbi:hypothetical protein NPIL_501711 [Nephila pilipes]|uniref:Uncharacterized protein n=1 Tax=Nephila pilipes TaxID=299642 RepID=A0A8X6U8K9_NEPPI|nr:hypothetical protein NPIL_501711 [Nephila pilipes]
MYTANFQGSWYTLRGDTSFLYLLHLKHPPNDDIHYSKHFPPHRPKRLPPLARVLCVGKIGSLIGDGTAPNRTVRSS